MRKPMLGRGTAESLPAPVGGWNARDALGDMAEDDAVAMVNYFPGTTSVELRAGHTRYATGISGQVETVMAYSGGATNKLLAIGNNSVYDVTAGGAVGAAALSSLTNSRWQYINVATAGGNYIEMCNGADSVYTFDGSTWTAQSGNITNVTSSNLININLFKNRVWFIEKNTLKAWYLPTQSISGAAAALDLSAFAPHGGYLMAMATWTIDAGYGVDDLAVFITSNGDCIVYRGTDPSSASTWALVGVWWLGSPIGRRCFVKYKGDLLLITQDGLLPLSGALQSSRLQPRVALSDKISAQISAATSAYGSTFGWQILPFPKESMLLLNVPVQAGNIQEQYVMNMITGAWCDFQGWNANCWELYQDDIYFGGNTFVGKAWNTYSDNGSAIAGNILQAFNYFKTPGKAKRFTRMRPTLLTNGSPSIQGSINTEFDTSAPATALSTVGIAGAVWDTGVWDTALWAETLTISRQWQGANGIGYCGAPRFSSSSTGLQIQLISTDVVMEPSMVPGL